MHSLAVTRLAAIGKPRRHTVVSGSSYGKLVQPVAQPARYLRGSACVCRIGSSSQAGWAARRLFVRASAEGAAGGARSHSWRVSRISAASADPPG